MKESNEENEENWQDRQKQDEDEEKQSILDDLAYLYGCNVRESILGKEKLQRLAYGLGLGQEFKQLIEEGK